LDSKRFNACFPITSHYKAQASCSLKRGANLLLVVADATALILALAHLFDGNPVLSFGRNIKFLSRYLYGFVCIGSLNRAKTFGAMPEDIDTPTSHLSETPCRSGYDFTNRRRALATAPQIPGLARGGLAKPAALSSA
jgi:hypothetical protein